MDGHVGACEGLLWLTETFSTGLEMVPIRGGGSVHRIKPERSSSFYIFQQVTYVPFLTPSLLLILHFDLRPSRRAGVVVSAP